MNAHEVEPPSGIDAEAWFGACYAGAAGDGLGKGMCVALYRFGDDGIAEIRSYHKHRQNRSGGKALTKIAAAALAE